MRRLGLTLAFLALATPAAAQYYGSMQPSRPGNGSPNSQPGSYSNPYIVRDQYGNQQGTVYSARPNGSGNSAPGGYANPYQFHPNPYQQQRR